MLLWASGFSVEKESKGEYRLSFMKITIMTKVDLVFYYRSFMHVSGSITPLTLNCMSSDGFLYNSWVYLICYGETSKQLSVFIQHVFLKALLFLINHIFTFPFIICLGKFLSSFIISLKRYLDLSQPSQLHKIKNGILLKMI